MYKCLKNKFIFRIGSILVLSVATLGLAGCASGKAGASQSGWVITNQSTKQLREDDYHVLRQHGVQVIKLGETVRLVVPSHRLFHPGSAEMRAHYRSILNTVADLLNTYSIVSVKVAAYASAQSKSALHLTNRQAQAVQSYLSDRGIKARLIYAVGRGGKHPVAWNGELRGRQVNRRVEISFRFYPSINQYD